MKDSSGMGLGAGGCGGGGGEKDQYVQQIKNFQRQGTEQKELWGAYADTYLGGVRDPSRHDLSTLQEFCFNHNVPSVGSGGSPAGGMGGGLSGLGGAYAS